MDWNELPKSKAEAIEQGVRWFYTGEPCKRGHICPKYTRNGHCIECHREDTKAWKERNREHRMEYLRRWRAENREKIRAENIVQKRVRKGTMERPDNCERCGAPGKLHAHHHDYSRPTDVEWLCPKCHIGWHTDELNGRLNRDYK